MRLYEGASFIREIPASLYFHGRRKEHLEGERQVIRETGVSKRRARRGRLTELEKWEGRKRKRNLDPQTEDSKKEGG